MSAGPGLRAQLLGQFVMASGDRTAGPWPRPSARRLVELLLVSPGHRIRRDAACEALFGDRDQRSASRALSKALSLARAALADLGPSLLAADLTSIWIDGPVETDAEVHEAALRTALTHPAGPDRARELRAALDAVPGDGELLPDEPDEEWARWPRERLAALRQEARLALARDLPPAPGPPPAPETPAAAPREDRRPVSVLFAEVAVSPAVLGSGDLETLRESVGRVLAVVMTEAESLGGTVTSVSGRGLQALFGVPSAHEDDPERAVRAAYRAVARTSPAAALRIGVESGPAVVGPVAGAGRGEYAAFSDAVSVAAALQSAARPGSVLVGPATRAATEHLFTWDTAEKVALDPGAEPVTASYLDEPRARSGGRRPALGGTAPLTGRDAEIRILAGALRDLAGGRGSVVALTGEPGIGKTRLVQEARTRFAAWTGARTGRLPLWLVGRGSSYVSGIPYGLYRDLLGIWTGISPDQPAGPRLAALEESLVRVTGNANLLPPLARMAGLPGTPADTAGPAEIQRMIIDAIRALLTRLTALAPTVLVLEDLHWADPTSLHLTRHLADLTRERPLLMLVTARDEGAPDIDSIAPGARPVRLSPLPDSEARALARSLLGDAADDVLDAVAGPAGGNPLFVEERLAALLETRALVRDAEAWSLRDTPGPRLSQVLERLVRSRIDRLSPAAQKAVRAASVLGSEFSAAQLSAMLDEDSPGTLEPVLDELQASDLIHHRRPRAPEPVFAFRHALLGEAAYLGLLRAERRALHVRAARAIEAAAGGYLPDVAAVLARHYAAAGEAGQSLRYLEMAGDHATDAFANDEAIASFRAAIELATRHDAMSEAAVRLYDKLANVLWRTERRGETREAFEDALRIAESTGAVGAIRRAHLHTRLGRVSMPDSLFPEAAASFDAAEALLGEDPGGQDDEGVDQWLEMMIEGRAALYAALDDLDRADAMLDQSRPLLEARGAPARKAEFYRMIALHRMRRNDMRPGDDDLDLIRRSFEFGRQTGEEKDAAYAEHVLAWALGLRGDLAEARRHEESAVDLAERIGEAFLLPATLAGLALIALHQGEAETARSALARAMTAASAADDSIPWEPAARCVLAWLDGRQTRQLLGELADLMDPSMDTCLGSVLYLARGLGRPA